MPALDSETERLRFRQKYGGVAEWLGKGLQIPPPRFNSGRRLQPKSLVSETSSASRRLTEDDTDPNRDRFVAGLLLIVGLASTSSGLWAWTEFREADVRLGLGPIGLVMAWYYWRKAKREEQ